MTAPRVIVVGGGIGGLSLAHTLLQETRARGAGVNVTVLEAGRPGGHARTITEGGFLVEGGPNGFLDREPETLALIKSLGLESQLIEARPEAKRRFIVRSGRLCKVPDSPSTLITTDALGVRSKLRMLLEPFAPGPAAGVDETVFDFARRRIGREAADMLVDAAVSGISAGDSRVLSVAAQFPMMVEMERDHGSLVRAMIARRKRRAGPSRLLAFKGGMAMLVDALLEQLGERVRANTAVRSIERTDGVWRVTTDRGEILEADRVVLTVSARAAARIAGALDPELASLFDRIPFSGISLVALAYRTQDIPRSLDGYGYLTTRAERLATLGVVWESSLFPGRAPHDMALLRVFLGGARRPDIASLGESATVQIAREELRQVMHIEAAPTRSWTFQWPAAIAQYNVGHLERVKAIRARLARHEGLLVCGTSYDGASFNGAITSGRAMARSIAQAITQPIAPTIAGGGLQPGAEIRGSEGPRLPVTASRPTSHVVLVTYGEPPTPAFLDQLTYSWRILLGLTRTIAPIPKPILPLIALSRARTRHGLWTRERYESPLEPLTTRQAEALRWALTSLDDARDRRVHVAYEFRRPLLPEVLATIPADELVTVIPMYAADSDFTHGLSRTTVSDVTARHPRRAPLSVLAPIDADVLADAIAAHVLESIGPRSEWTGRGVALVLAAHGTLLEPTRPIDTGLHATERLCDAIRSRLSDNFGEVVNGWLNHTRGGKWTEPAMNDALRQIVDRGFSRAVYFPYGFLADNAESQLEGRIALRAHPTLKALHLPCLNESRFLIDALARMTLGRPEAATPAASRKTSSADHDIPQPALQR